MWFKKVTSLHSFAESWPVFPTLFTEGALFCPVVCCYLLCHRLIDHISVDVFQGLCFVLLICVFVFMPVPYCFDDYSFTLEVSLEVRELDASKFALVSQGCFSFLRSLKFHTNFTSICSSSPNMS